ncbi:MAG: type I methionyl aminopeptidase, partial [Candidatus Babeliales bacterium]
NKASIQKMEEAGRLLSHIFQDLVSVIRSGISTLDIDQWIAEQLRRHGLVSAMRGYRGYRYVSCISVNDVVVHGIPAAKVILAPGDLVKVDVCASWKGYCADMARSFFVGSGVQRAQELVAVAQKALDKGIAQAKSGNHLSDISSAIQREVEAHGFGVVRDFAGHGIGKDMHEEPEILNYGKPGVGPVLRPGMAFALEPMITMGHYDVYVAHDGWTVKTSDKSLAAHVEDTIVITDGEPKVVTRLGQ